MWAFPALVFGKISIWIIYGAGCQIIFGSQLESLECILLFGDISIVPIFIVQVVLVDGSLEIDQPGWCFGDELVIGLTALCIYCFVHDIQIILGLTHFECQLLITGASLVIAFFQ